MTERKGPKQATRVNWKLTYERLLNDYRKVVIKSAEDRERWMKQLRDNMVTITQLQNELEDSRQRERLFLHAFNHAVDNSDVNTESLV